MLPNTRQDDRTLVPSNQGLHASKGSSLWWLIAGLLSIGSPLIASDNASIKKRDVNNDGIADQVAEFDHQGKLIIACSG